MWQHDSTRDRIKASECYGYEYDNHHHNHLRRGDAAQRGSISVAAQKKSGGGLRPDGGS